METIERLGGTDVCDFNQKQEWIRAIMGGTTPLSNFNYAATMTEAMLLGNVAVRLGKTLEYDVETGTVPTFRRPRSSFVEPIAKDGS